MYKLEDRILFDAAAVADVADAQQEADAQAEAAAQAAEAEEAAAQEAAESADGGDFDNTEANEPGSLEAVLAAVEAGNLGSDGQRVDVLLVSGSLENAEDIINATSSDTIVVRYDARTTSAADLLQQITDALDGNVADSIGFATESGENAEVQLFADSDTSLDTVNDSIHQTFFSGLDSILDEGAQVNLFASNLASTAEGTALVDAIGDSIGHDVAASIDETGAESAGGDWNLEYSTNDVEVNVAETYLDENLIDNFDSLLEDHTNHEVAFINSSVMNVDEILDDLGADVEVVMLENGSDGLDNITDYLNEHSDVKYDAVHIITHGNEGYFVLNGQVVDGDYVSENASDFVQWRNALSDDADIMIYGCNLAGSLSGESLIANIASLTGADVAASEDTIGGSDWSLEYAIGDINYGAFDINNYDYHLADQIVANTNNLGVGSLRAAIAAVGSGESVTFANGLAGATITLDSGITLSQDLSISNGTGGTITVDGQAGTVFSVTGGTATLNNLILTSTGTTVAVSGGDVVLGSVTLDGGAMTVASGDTVTAQGQLSMTNSAILTIDSGATFEVDAVAVPGLDVQSGTVNLNGTMDINTSADIASGAELLVSSTGTLNLSGHLLVDGFLQLASGSSWNYTGSFDGGSGEVEYEVDGAGTTTMVDLTYNDLTLTGATSPAADSLTWSNQRVTGELSFDNITVDAVNINNNVNDLNMENGAILNVSNAFAISGTFTHNDDSTVNYDGGNAQFIAEADYFNLTISGSGDKTAAGDIGIAGAFVSGGTANFTPANYTVTYNGTDQAIALVDYHDLVLGGSGTKTLDDPGDGDFEIAGQMELANDNVTLDVVDTFNITDAHFTNTGYGTVLYSKVANSQTVNSLHYNDLNMTGGTKLAAGDIWLTGDFTTTASAVDLTTNTTTFSLIGTGAQSFDNIAFHNLVLEGGGTKTLATGDLSVDNDMTLDDGVSLAVTGSAGIGNDLNAIGGSSLTVSVDADITNDMNLAESSNVTVSGDTNIGNDLIFDNSSSILNLGGTLALASFTSGQGTVNYNDSSDGQEILDLNYYNLALGGGDKTAEDGFGVTNDLTFTGALALEVEEDTISVGGTFLHGNGSIEYSSSVADQAIANLTYYDLILSNANKVAASGFGVANDLTFDSAFELDVQSNTISVAGTFDNGSGLVCYSDADPGQTIADLDYYDLVLEGGNSKSGTDIDVSNDLELNDGTTVTITGDQSIGNDFVLNNASTVNIGGTLDVSNETALNDDSTLNVDGDMTTVDLTFDANDSLLFGGTDLTVSGTFTPANGTITYDGANQNISSLSDDYYNLILDGTGTKTAAADFDVTNDMTFATPVTLDVSNGTFSVGGTFAHGDGTVQYSQTSGTQDIAGLSYYNLTIAENSTKSLDGAIEVENAFTLVNSGSFDANGNMVTYNGDNQTILGVSYYDLTLESSTGASPRSQKTSAASLSVTNDFDMQANTELVLNGAISIGNDTTFDSDSAVNYAGNNQTIEVLTSGVNPVSYENLIISGSGTKFWNSAAGVVQTLLIKDSSELIVDGAFSLTTATVDVEDTAVLTLNGTVSVTNTFTAGTDTTVKYAASTSIPQNIIATDYGHLVLEGNGDRYLTGDIGIAKTFTVASGLGFHHVNHAVDYNGDSTQTIASASYYDIILSGTGDKIWNSGITLSSDLIFDSDITLEVSTPNLDAVSSLVSNTQGTVKYAGVDQDVTALDYHNLTLGGRIATLQGDLGLSGSLTINTDATLETDTHAIALPGDWTNNGTFNANSNLVTFSGTAAQTIGGSSTTVFNDFTLNNAAGIAGSANVTISGTVLDTDGSVDMSGGTFTYSGADQTVIDGTYNNLTLTGTGTATSSGEISVSSLLNVDTGQTFDIADNNLTVDGATTVDGTLTATTATVDINDDLDFSGGTISFTGAGQLEFSGTNLSVGTYTAGTSRFVYDGASQTIADLTYYDLELAGSGNRTVTLSNSLNDFYLTSGSATLGAALDVDGSITMDNGTTLDAAGFAINVFVDWDNSGTFTANGNTVTFDGSALQTITSLDYYNLTLSGSGNKDAVDVNVAGDLTFSSNITLSVSDALSVTGTLTPAQGTINYDGADQNITDLAYYNLELSGTGTKTGTDVTSTNDLIFGSDVTLTISGALDIGNDLDHGSQGTISYLGDNTQTVFGTDYYNLTINDSDKALGGNSSVEGTFDFDSAIVVGSGDMVLGDYNLNLLAGSQITGQSSKSYFVSNGTGTLDIGLSTSTREITIGSADEWSNLRLVNSDTGDTQTVSLQATDGVSGVSGSGIVDMTFSVTNRSEDFIMTVLDSSVKGADFNPVIAGINYDNTGTWTELGYQFTTDLTSNGDYYFSNLTLTAADLYVTTAEYLGGHGSLIFAVTYANSNPGLDTITFDPSVFNSYDSETITIDALLGSAFEITDSLIIDGPGYDAVTIDADNLTAIFTINNVSEDIYVVINGMTLINGSNTNGGAIYNNEFLELNNVVISDSSATYGGGIYNDFAGSIYMNKVKISGNEVTSDGGGIYNRGGKIQAENLWVTANTADRDGAGIYNDRYSDGGFPPTVYVGEITLQNTTIDNSDATRNGGAIFNQGRLYGENITLSNNTAAEGSAVYIDSQGIGTTSTTFFNATVGLNDTTSTGGYAVYRATPADDNLYLNSSLLTGNSDDTTTYLNISDTSTNYIGIENYNVAASAGTAGTLITDGIFRDSAPIDHGGWVPTLALNTANTTVQDSIMDQGSNDGPTIYDARGYMRYGIRDIGAYEAGFVDGGTVYAGAYMARNVSRNLYYTSVQGAIDNAQAGENIELFGTRYHITSELDIGKDLIISGQGKDVTVLDAKGLYSSTAATNRLLAVNHVSDTLFVRVNGMTFRNGGGVTDGGAIHNSENLLLENVSIYGSTATSDGGAIYNDGGYLYIERSEIYNNNVTNLAGDVYGGAIYNDEGKVRIAESSLYANLASGVNALGGAIYTSDDNTGAAALTIISSALYDNTATGTTDSVGGAIFATGANQVEITNSTFAHNSAEYSGAMYFTGAGTYKMTNITVAYNKTSYTNSLYISSYAVGINEGTLYSINSLFLANYNSGSKIDQDMAFTVGTTTTIFNSTYNESSTGYFADTRITDNGGWSKTIALASNSAAINAGMDSGVPDHDQRGYDSNGTRDQGAYEYDGYVAYYWNDGVNPTSPIAKGWVGTSTISAAGVAGMSEFDPAEHIIKLVNTRILEANISIKAWVERADSELASRTVYIYGHQEGGTVIDANYQGQIFNVIGDRYIPNTDYIYVMGTTNINRLAMTNGFTTGSGGAIRTTNASDSGVININDSSITNSIALGQGGAIVSKAIGWTGTDKKDATYNINSSLVAYNTAVGSGGAVSITKTVNVSDSTIAYNRSFSNGGAIMVNADGGGAINRSTVSRNFASTNGGGLYLNNGYSVGNTLLAKNRTAGIISPRVGGNADLDPDYESGYDYFWSEGTLGNGGHNLVEYQNGHWVKDVTTNFFGPKTEEAPIEISNGDILGPQDYVFSDEAVADHGGWSYTMELAQNSAAKDKGSGTTADQRGYDVNREKDIGAFELNGIVATVDGGSYSTLAEAIAAAPADSTITLVGSRILGHDLQIARNMTIQTANSDSYYSLALIDAQNYGRVFAVEGSSISASLANMILANGAIMVGSGQGGQAAAGNGGAIFSAGTLNLSEVSIAGSFAQLSGGAIYSTKSLSVTTAGIDETMHSATPSRGAYFASNSAQGNGGAIYASNDLSLSGVSETDAGEYATGNMLHFDYNFANAGGAVYTSYVDNDTYVLDGVQFTGNNAVTRGGALYGLGNTDITFNAVSFNENATMRDGGAMYFKTTNALTFRDVNFSGNLSFGDGGALYYDGLGNSKATLTYFNSNRFSPQSFSASSNASFKGSGGAFYVKDANQLRIYSKSISSSISFSSNEALLNGGAVYVTNTGTGTDGYAVVLGQTPGVNTISNLTSFNSNTAGQSGGAFYIEDSGHFYADENVYMGNNIAGANPFLANASSSSYRDLSVWTGDGKGGAVYFKDSGNFTYKHVGSIYDNTARNFGGAFYIEDSGLINLDDTKFADNASGEYFGATSFKTVADGTVSGAGRGGALYLKGNENIVFNDLDFYDNHAIAEGGAVYVENGTNEDRAITINNSSFDRNMIDDTSTAYGGALYVDNAIALNIANSSFAFNDNTALYLGYGSMSLNFTTFAYNATGADTNVLGINLAGATGETSQFVVNNSILHDGTSTSGGTISGTPYSFGTTVVITTGQSTNNIYTNYNLFTGTNVNNLAGTPSGDITAYLPYGDTGATATVRDSYANLIGDTTGTTSDFITENLYLSNDMDYTGNRDNRTLALQSVNSIANRYEFGGSETFAGNIAQTASYNRSGTFVSGSLMLIDNIASISGWSQSGNEYSTSATQSPLAVSSNGVVLTAGIVGSLSTGEWAWDSENSTIVVRLADDVSPSTTAMTTRSDKTDTIIYDQRGNMRSGVTIDIGEVLVEKAVWTAYGESGDEYQVGSDYEVTNAIITFDAGSLELTEGTSIESLEYGQWIRDAENNIVIMKLAPPETEWVNTVLVLTTEQTTYTYYTYGELDSEQTWIKVTVAETGTTRIAATAADVNAGIGAFKANLYMTVTTNADNTQSPYYNYDVPEFTTMDNALANGVTLREAVYWIDTYNLTSLTVSGLTGNVKFDADRYVKFADSMFDGTNNLITLSAGHIITTSNVVVGMINEYNDLYYEDSSSEKHYFEADNTFLAQTDDTRITLIGNGSRRIFDNTSHSDLSDQSSSWSVSPTLGVNNLTLKDGFVNSAPSQRTQTHLGLGGAIYNSTTMYLNNAVVKDSVATNAGTGGSGSSLGRGGGIYNTGTMVISDSTISGNEANGASGYAPQSAGRGGGIYNVDGYITIKRSLIADNFVTAAIDKDTSIGNSSGTGGGIFHARVNSSILRLYSSTVSGNYITADSSETVDGAAITVWNATAYLYDNTISYNKAYDGTGQDPTTSHDRPGYAVYLRDGTVSLVNNLIAQNYIDGDVSQNRRDIIVKNDVSLTDFHNIVGSYYQATGYYDFAAHVGTSNDILGFNASGLVGDLNMSSDLLFNGGMTRNYRIESGSVAIGNALDTSIDYDQRNALKNIDFGSLRSTIGAYELITKISVSSDIADAAIPADGIAYDYTNDEGGWNTNLRNGLYLADQDATVTVTVVTDYETVTLVGGELLIFNGLTLTTLNDVELTIDAGETSRLFAITDPTSAGGVDVTLKNLSLINGDVAIDDRGGLGGAIYTTEGLTLENVTITNVTAASHGGAIYSLSGGLTLTDVTIDNAESTNGDGGAINLQTDAFAATHLTVMNSTAGGSGGAIYITDGSTFSLTSNANGISEIHDNESGSYGGGIYFSGGNMTITDAYIYDNAAASDKDGGGLYVNSSGNITITTSTFGNNTAGTGNGNTAARGAGIFVYAGSLSMTNSTISGNTATKNGGGLYFDGTTLELTYVTIANNYAGDGYHGGGVYMNNGSLTMTNTVIAQNYAGTTATASDFYLDGGSVGSATYSAIGQSNYDFLAHSNTNIVGNASGIIVNLGMDTSLYDNGGDTPTLYVMGNSDLVGAGYNTVSGIYSQNNKIRVVGTKPDGPTIGAYEGGSTTYYFVGDNTLLGGLVTDAKSWNTDKDAGYDVAGNPDFDDADNLYTFTNNGHAGVLSTGEWEISDRSSVSVAAAAAASFTISGDAIVKAFVHRTGVETNMTISVKDAGNLIFNNEATQLVTLSSLGEASNISYTLNTGTVSQTVYTATYGNLTISGSTVTKTAEGAITVNGTGAGLAVTGSTFVLAGNLTGSGDIILTNGIITGGTYDITNTGDLTGTDTNTISGADISLATASSYVGDITATGTLTTSGSLDIEGDISATTIALSGTTNEISGDITATEIVTISGGTDIVGDITGTTVNIDGGAGTLSVNGVITSTTGAIDIQSTGTIIHSGTLTSATDIAVYGAGSTITVGSATTTTGNIYIGGSDTGTANQATSATIANSTISSTSGAIYLNAVTNILGGSVTLGSEDNSDLTINGALQSTAGTNTIYYGSTNPFTHAVTINNNSILNFNIGANDATISGAATPTTTLFNLNYFTVNTGTLGIITSGDITMSNVDTNTLTNFNGTLSVTCNDISFTGTNDFSLGTMNFDFNNSGYFKLSGDLEFKNDITITGDVMLTGSGPVNATLSSSTGSVTVGNVTTDTGVTAGNITLQAADAKNATIGGTSGNINNVTLTSSGTLDTATVDGAINNSGNFAVTAADIDVNSNITSGGNVSITGALDLAADIAAATGSVTINGVTTISGTGDTSISANSLILGAINGAGTGTLTLETTLDSTLSGVDINGGLTLSSGTFESDGASATIEVGNLNIASPATLTMGANALTASNNLTNAGTLSSTGTVTATNGYISNTGLFAATTATATNGSIINTSGTFNATTATAGTSLTNAGTLTVATANVGTDLTNTGNLTISTALNLTDSGASVLNFGGDFSTNLLTIGADKLVNLTNGNVTVNTLNFTGTIDSSSKFELASGTSLDVAGAIDYNVSVGYYDGNYFNTSGGGELIRTMGGVGTDIIYRVGNSSAITVITLQAADGKIAAGILDSVKISGTIVTGIQETVNTTMVLDRKTGTDNTIYISVDWQTDTEGLQFDSTDAERFELIDNVWTSQGAVTVDTTTTPGRSIVTYNQPHNGTYTFANVGANLTIPFTGPGINGNIAIWEMSNPNYSSILGDVDNLSNFPIGQYPYFSTRGIFGDPSSVGQAVYRQMEYRLAMNPLTNPLTGQVPTTGALIGEAITEGASLNLTSDASAYLETNGEYSIGRGWLPISEPASASNIEQYQAPITEGQLDEFYLEFGGREGFFDKPTSFRSDLDELLDDLMAG